MKTDYYKEFEMIALKKERTMFVLEDMKKNLQQFILHNNVEYLRKIEDAFNDDSIFVFSEMNHIRILCKIISTEINNERIETFSNSVEDVNSLFEKYFNTVFALRRIELNLDETGILQAYDYLEKNHISIECIVGILANNLFSYPAETARKVYDCIRAKMGFEERMEWLFIILASFRTEEIYLTIASEYISVRRLHQALSVMEMIEKPSDNTKELIGILRKVAK